jgi:heptosyltransferase II
MRELTFQKILVIQTAFIGDAILTLPLLQVLKRNYPQSTIDVVAVPRTVEIFSNHPAIFNIHVYDKHGKDKGIRAFWKLRNQLSKQSYDFIVVPHRSMRSAMLTWLLNPRKSIGFDRSAGRVLFTDVVRYESQKHEIDRNLSLLNPLMIKLDTDPLPIVYPSDHDIQVVNSLLDRLALGSNSRLIAIAPGTIWYTKRWPAERFSALCDLLSNDCDTIFLLGAQEDMDLCNAIQEATPKANIEIIAGKLSLLQSAELIRRCKVIVSNDSAPMHLAVAVGIPVIAIFGATVPEYGFAPRGPHDSVVEIKGLPCRPCAIHGGKVCPIKTFECMLSISPEMITRKVQSFMGKR